MVNIYLNEFLKLIIIEPRPSNQIKYLDDEYLTGSHVYGMPSGHAQNAFFFIVYLMLLKGINTVTLISLFIGFITLYQRWKYRKHDVKQLSVGAIIGSVFGYFMYHLTTYYLHRK